jgi:hypothetical protein
MTYRKKLIEVSLPLEAMNAAPFNLRLFSLPLGWITWLDQKQYQAENIQQFFEESI